MQPGTFHGVQRAIRREQRNARDLVPQVGSCRTGRKDVPRMIAAQYVHTAERPLRMGSTSHTRVVPARLTQGDLGHMPTMAGTRHNSVLPSSQAEIDAHQAFQAGKFKHAVQLYNLALEQAANPYVHRCLAASMAALGDLRGALWQTECMVRLEPFNKKARFLRQAVADAINAVAAGAQTSGSRCMTVALLITPEELKVNAYRMRMTVRPVRAELGLPADEKKLLRHHKIDPHRLKVLKSGLPAGANATTFGSSVRGGFPAGKTPTSRAWPAVGEELATTYTHCPVGGHF
eukprot:TRINITY_DN48960_c0_g2_i1.p1 TRINITY_DN48960_c0_g2~~TRINITY_DN48960_c0_g2_i1.p1  ORF type:complete len:290 (-),score=46.32 TRINITY_DN48960_c0_g2_i1:392-1261(-)